MKISLLALALLLPLQALSVEKDSVYTWGQWAKGIQPAAGSAASAATPAPVQLTEVSFRPNESPIFTRPSGPIASLPRVIPSALLENNPRNRR